MVEGVSNTGGTGEIYARVGISHSKITAVLMHPFTSSNLAFAFCSK